MNLNSSRSGHRIQTRRKKVNSRDGRYQKIARGDGPFKSFRFNKCLAQGHCCILPALLAHIKDCRGVWVVGLVKDSTSRVIGEDTVLMWRLIKPSLQGHYNTNTSSVPQPREKELFSFLFYVYFKTFTILHDSKLKCSAWPLFVCLDLNRQMLKSWWLDHYCNDYYVSSYVWQQFF